MKITAWQKGIAGHSQTINRRRAGKVIVSPELLQECNSSTAGSTPAAVTNFKIKIA